MIMLIICLVLCRHAESNDCLRLYYDFLTRTFTTYLEFQTKEEEKPKNTRQRYFAENYKAKMME
jgi:hypothetical protein